MSDLRMITGVAAVISGAVSIGVILLLSPSSENSSNMPEQMENIAAYEQSITELQNTLDLERNERLLLEEHLNELRDVLVESGLLFELQYVEDNTSSSQPPQSEIVGKSKAGEEEVTENIDLESEFSKLQFSEQALLDAGLSASEIEVLRQHFEEAEREKVAVNERALSEGYSENSQHSRELREVQTRLRSTIGDQDYDKILYAMGRMNRVQVNDLLRGSVGANSGLIAGDVIYSYAGVRIFDPTALHVLSKNGQVTDSVQIQVMRNGELVSLTTSGGQLGAKVNHTQETPNN